MDHRFGDKRIRLLGYVVLLILLVLAIVFYRERTLFTDIAFQSFNLIVSETPKVQVYRFGAIVVHFFPLLAIKLSWPLSWVLLLFSAAYPILYLLAYHLLVKYFKNDYLGLVLIFMLCLSVFDSFYWPNSELWQGMVALLVFYGFLLRFPKLESTWHKTLALLFLPLLIFYHPLMPILFLFCWLFFYGLFAGTQKKFYFLIMAGAMGIVVVKAIFFQNWYDQAKQTEFLNNLYQFFPNYWALPSNQKFLLNSIKLYYFIPILFFGVLGYYLYRKQWKSLGLILIFCVAYLFLVNVGAPRAINRFYVEVSYVPLILFLSLALVFELLPRFRTRQWLFPVLLLVFALRLSSIYVAHRPFSERLDWMVRKLDQLGDQKRDKFIMRENEIPLDTLIMTWGMAYESLLLSALEHPDSARTIFLETGQEEFPPYLKEGGYFLGKFSKIPLSELPHRYFRLDSSGYFRIEQ